MTETRRRVKLNEGLLILSDALFNLNHYIKKHRGQVERTQLVCLGSVTPLYFLERRMTMFTSLFEMSEVIENFPLMLGIIFQRSINISRPESLFSDIYERKKVKNIYFTKDERFSLKDLNRTAVRGSSLVTNMMNKHKEMKALHSLFHSKSYIYTWCPINLWAEVLWIWMYGFLLY